LLSEVMKLLGCKAPLIVYKCALLLEKLGSIFTAGPAQR
jgi:hypothetical protein